MGAPMGVLLRGLRIAIAIVLGAFAVLLALALATSRPPETSVTVLAALIASGCAVAAYFLWPRRLGAAVERERRLDQAEEASNREFERVAAPRAADNVVPSTATGGPFIPPAPKIPNDFAPQAPANPFIPPAPKTANEFVQRPAARRATHEIAVHRNRTKRDFVLVTAIVALILGFGFIVSSGNKTTHAPPKKEVTSVAPTSKPAATFNDGFDLNKYNARRRVAQLPDIKDPIEAHDAWLIDPNPNLKPFGKLVPEPARPAVYPVDRNFWQDFRGHLLVGKPYALIGLQVLMTDTRYIEADLSPSSDQRFNAKVADVELHLVEKIKSACSTIGIQHEGQKEIISRNQECRGRYR